MKLLSLVLLLPMYLISLQSKAQNFTENDVKGNWTITEVITTKPVNETQKKVVAGFKNGVFVFNNDHSFELKTQDKSIYITMLKQQLAKAQWQFIANTKEIKIGTLQNNYSILNIEIKEKDNNTILFVLSETGIGLVVRKT